MKWTFGLPESPTLVYYYMKLAGLAPFTVRNNEFHPPTFLDKLYPLFVAASYLLFVSLTFVHVEEILYATKDSPFLKIWTTIIHLIGIPTLLGTIVTFLMMHKKIICLMSSLGTISNELENLDIKQNRGKFFRNLLVTIVTVNTVLVTLWILLYSIKPQQRIVFLIKYCVESWFTINTILFFTQLQFSIRKCFTVVNEVLYGLAMPASHRRCPKHSRILITVVSENERDNRPETVNFCIIFQRLQIIEILHMELSDLLHQTTHLFATPILLNCVGFSVRLVLYSYWIYHQLLRSSDSEIVSISSCVLRMVFVSVQLFVIAYASVTTCEEGNATKAVLFKMWNEYTPADLKDENINRMFAKFSHQLRHTTVAVSVFGITDLGYSFICKIFSTVMTYLIIVIQFDTSPTSF